MGYRIASAHPQLPASGPVRPHFVHGVALQWLNPKAWIASLSGISAFEATLGNGLLAFAGLYLVLCFGSVALWAYAGARVSNLLQDDGVLRWCNRLLGVLLIGVAFYLLYLHWQH